MAYHELLRATCTISGTVVNQDAHGQPIETVVVKARDVRTRRTSLTDRDPQTIGDFPVTPEVYKFYFLPNQDITLADKILFKDDEYDVQFVTTDSSESVKTVYAKIVKYG